VKLPPALAALADKIVVSESKVKLDSEPLSEPGYTGIVFDWSTFKDEQISAVMDHFGDCAAEDFQDLLEDGELKPEWMPFMLWRPDGLDDEHDVQVKKQEKKPATKTVAFARDGEFPQFCSMWFLHETGRVVCIQVDGTFMPAPKADALVKDYKLLELRPATYADLGRDED
jgi:hypothetical protein